MLRVLANIFTFIGAIWLSAHLFWLQRGHREEVLDQFLRSPELDFAVDAALQLIQAFSLPVVALALCSALWRRDKSMGSQIVGLTALGTVVVGLIVYFILPPYQDTLQRSLLEHMKASQP